MKPDRDLRAAALALMGTVAVVGIVRGLVPPRADAAPTPPVLVRPQMSSGDAPDGPGTLHLNAPLADRPGTAGRAKPRDASPANGAPPPV